MSRADLVLTHLKRYGSIKYERVRQLTGARNVPDIIYALRKRGYTIQSVNKVNDKGTAYTERYAYHS